MDEVTIIGIDLAKNSFQLHGARADGSVAFRKKRGRARLMTFLAEQPHCVVAMEACELTWMFVSQARQNFFWSGLKVSLTRKPSARSLGIPSLRFLIRKSAS